MRVPVRERRNRVGGTAGTAARAREPVRRRRRLVRRIALALVATIGLALAPLAFPQRGGGRRAMRHVRRPHPGGRRQRRGRPDQAAPGDDRRPAARGRRRRPVGHRAAAGLGRPSRAEDQLRAVRHGRPVLAHLRPRLHRHGRGARQRLGQHDLLHRQGAQPAHHHHLPGRRHRGAAAGDQGRGGRHRHQPRRRPVLAVPAGDRHPRRDLARLVRPDPQAGDRHHRGRHLDGVRGHRRGVVLQPPRRLHRHRHHGHRQDRRDRHLGVRRPARRRRALLPAAEGPGRAGRGARVLRRRRPWWTATPTSCGRRSCASRG